VVGPGDESVGAGSGSAGERPVRSDESSADLVDQAAIEARSLGELREALREAYQQLLLRDEEIASLRELAEERDTIRLIQSTRAWRVGMWYWRTRDRLRAMLRGDARR
jgi:hypothetical protein